MEGITDQEYVNRIMQGKINPVANDCHAFRWSCENGHINVVEQLLGDSRVDPAIKGNVSLFWAAYFKHLDIVELLLRDNRVSRDMVKQRATKENFPEVIKVLEMF